MSEPACSCDECTGLSNQVVAEKIEPSKPEPTQSERVAQLQAERDEWRQRTEDAEAQLHATTDAHNTLVRELERARQALELLLDTVERGEHLTPKHPLVKQAQQLLNIRETPTSQSAEGSDAT